jgi:hypothetical protein
MAIRIPILTSFDPKGLKAANTALAGLSSSVTSLTRNFALVGAGIAAGTALLGKAVMSASQFEAEFEGVNQVFKEAAGSVQAFADQAAKSAGLSATEALQASKTFGLFATGAGLGVQEAAKFSTTMVQLAGDLGSFNDVPTADALAAIQSGLMGQSEPLRRFGVFLDAARLRQEALNMGIYNGTGPLTTQQKMMASYSAILAQTTVQQGDFVAYGDTLGNQLKTISGDFQNLTKDIGQMLIPVITEAMPQIKEMALVIGEQLKKAIGSIDWKATIQAVIDFTSFLVANAETIAKVVAAIFILNTAFKLMAVASGIAKVAIALQTWVTAQLATGLTLTTVATNLLSAAMRLIPFVAVVTGLYLTIDSFNRTKTAIKNTASALSDFETNSIAAANTASQFSPYLSVFKLIAIEVIKATGLVDEFHAAAAGSKDSDSRNRRNALREENRRLGKIPGSKASSGLFDFSSLLSTFTGDGASSGSGSSLVDELNKELDKLAKEAERAAREAEKSMQKIEADAQAERERAAAAEQAVLDQRQNAYQSFTDSVKQLFGQIKDSILSSFNLPTLGNSVNSITRNISKLLERTKGFASSISRLSGMGLNSALLQQVIQAGPMQGSQLAAALVGGGAGFITQLNRAYGEFGDLAGGIAGVGTTGAFAGQQTINNYSIEVTGGLATGSDVGRAVVNAIRDYERQSGAAWRG